MAMHEVTGWLVITAVKSPQHDRRLRNVAWLIVFSAMADNEPQAQRQPGAVFRFFNRSGDHHQMRNLPRGKVPYHGVGVLGGRGVK